MRTPPKSNSAPLIFGIAALVLLFLARTGPAVNAPQRQRTLSPVYGDHRNGEGPPILLTYLFKPAPSRRMHGHCAMLPYVTGGRKLQLAEYTRLISLRACCTGRALLLITEDETVGLEGLLPYKECLGLPAAVWGVPPPWEEVVSAAASAQADEDEAHVDSGGSTAPIQRESVIVAMVVSDPSVMLPWRADLQTAVKAAAAGASFGTPTTNDQTGQPTLPLSVEIFMAGLTPYGYEKAAGASVAAVFEPLNWLGYDVTYLSHPIRSSIDDESEEGHKDAVARTTGSRKLANANSPGRPARASAGRSLLRRGAANASAAESDVSLEPGVYPPSEDPSATLQLAASAGRLPVAPLWLDWIGLQHQQWLGIHIGPGFLGEVISSMSSRPASLDPPRVMWGTAGGGAAAAASEREASSSSSSADGGAASGGRKLQQSAGQQQPKISSSEPALRVDGMLLRPGGAAARSAWLLWAAPSDVTAAALRPPTTPWGLQTLQYSTWRKVVTANAVLLRDNGAFFKRPGGVEAEVQHILSSIAAQACKPTSGSAGRSPSVLVDIGANAGYFAYLGALQGCTVLAMEPQQPCRQLLQFTREHNRDTVAPGVRTYPFGISVDAMSFDASWDGNCLGGYQVDEAAQRSAAADALHAASVAGGGAATATSSLVQSGLPVDVQAELRKTYTRPGDDVIGAALTSLSTVLPRGTVPTLAALKLDVEGHEVHVLRSLSRTLRSAQLFHIVIEIAPRKWPLTLKASDALRVLCDLLDTYSAMLLPDAEYPPETAKWPKRTVYGRTYPRVPGKGALKALLRNRISLGRGTNLYFALKVYDK